jgi:hypothetical protein
MATHSALAPLTAAGLIAKVREDGRLVVAPVALITRELDAYIRTHRDDLIAALSAPGPPWFAAWMQADDAARRIKTMADAMRQAERSRP